MLETQNAERGWSGVELEQEVWKELGVSEQQAEPPVRAAGDTSTPG